MAKKHRGRRKKKGGKVLAVTVTLIAVAAAGVIVWAFVQRSQGKDGEKPEDVLKAYMDCITGQEYDKMYEMIDQEEAGGVTREEFVERNSAIYEGIGVSSLSVKVKEQEEDSLTVSYETSMETSAGTVNFDNQVSFREAKEDGKKEYRLLWDDSVIFPDLTDTDKVRVSVTKAERGEIYDRNDSLLAGAGMASSVGIIPEKMDDREASVKKIAELLDMKEETIEKKLDAAWVKDNSFVPVKTLPRVTELDLSKVNPDKEDVKQKELQDQLLEVPGVMISDEEVRTYPLGEAAAHLVGYVQNVTAEDLEEHKGEGYSSDSVIGRSGAESLFEKELKGQDGYEIYIADEEGNMKEEIANLPVQDGKDIKLTIDSGIQKSLYKQFQEDKSCSVAMNPETGEVLALVSTPSYDNNDFILGISEEQMKNLNEDEKQPMYNRFRQKWCPGSTFKPITAAIGLTMGAIDPEEDYGNAGLSWQKDESWGAYKVTTLHATSPANLKNALINSDNIYFAKAALHIGAEDLKTSLDKLGFQEEVPFEIKMAKSQYSNTETIETEIQLADSGYGQGQMLMNPLHLACLYTAFSNEGNVIRPYLVYEEGKTAEYWIPEAFSPEVTETVLEGMKEVVNNPGGTGYAAHRDDILLAGKTGTAEIKASQDDTTGTELGWFSVFTAEETEHPILLLSMTEDVKEIGGSGYVVRKDKEVLKQYLEK